MSETATVRIDSIAAGGDGVGRVDGIATFVPRTAPGDVARVELARERRMARGRVLELLEPGAGRVEASCAHYVVDRCGGCQLQHLGYGAQLEAKRRMVGDALARIGRVVADPPAVAASPDEWRYRRKLTLAMRRVGDGWIAGLHAYDRPGEIFDLRDCPITDERVLAAWAQVRAAADELPRARELRVAVRLLDEGVGVVVEGGRGWPHAPRFLDAVPAARELWWRAIDGPMRRLLERHGAPALGASFVQVNPRVAAGLHERIVAVAMAHAPATAVDAYAGAGDTAAALAGLGVRVTALELDRAASRFSARRLPPGSRAVAGRVEETLADSLPADVVVLNPPRGGVDARVTDALAAWRPRAIVYVSCNPATLARDVGRLAGWRVASLALFDMFPQTAHVETVCELVPEAA